jgi:hypothetical protein
VSATISLDLIGATLRQIQADQREERLSRELLQGQLARLESRMVSREDFADLLRLFSQEISQVVSETREIGRAVGELSARFDRVDQQLAQLRGREER